jgi:penicillin-binding protein 2
MSPRRRRPLGGLRTAGRPAPRRPVPAGAGRRRLLGGRRRWFKTPRRPGAAVAARARAAAPALRNALRPVRLRWRRRPAKATRRRPPATPRMRPRKSVVERVVPGEPSPPRTIVRLRVLGLAVAAMFSLMFVRLWYLQVLDTSAYSQTVSHNQFRPVEVPAARGLILDRGGATLVGDQVTQDVTLAREAAQQHPEVVASLSTLLGISTAQIQADLSNPQYSLYKPVPVLENAPMSDVLYIGEHASAFPGVSVVADTTRTYPMGATGAQMLGYMGQIQKLRPGYQLGDQVGLAGLEAQYEADLRGVPGVDRVEVDAAGNVVGDLGQTPAQPGDDLVTNIDSGLEQTLQSALDAQIAQLHSSGGAVVAMDPQTGAVLALVSSPTYDPTWWTPNGITSAHYQQLQSDGSLNDYAIDGLYTPGSTFKLATATAALNDGLIGPGTYFDDPGVYHLGNSTFHDALGEAPGAITVSTAITISSDDFFYNLGVQFWDAYKTSGRYGETPIQDAANQLGFGDVTGIDLPGETDLARVDSPQVVQREHQQNPAAYPDGSWYAGNNLEMAFGQGGTVITPIDEAVAYSTFANGGTRYVPEIAAGIVDARGRVVKTFAPKAAAHVSYSAGAYEAMLSGFEGAVQSPSGTAYAAFTGFPLGTFPLAGKTGTADVGGSQPTSWFTGFGPVPDARYEITAVVSGGGYGEAAAAPVVRAGFDYLVNHPETPPELAAPTGTAPVSCPAPGAGSTTTTTAPRHGTTTTSAPGATTTTTPCPSGPTTTSLRRPGPRAPVTWTSFAAIPASRSRPPPSAL